MSHIRKGIFGALAICLVSGAMQFAFGHDLTGGEKISIAETSVLIRVPVTREEARSRPVAPPSAIKPGPHKSKTTLACEPVVSVLTEVAKLLQPGRCVT